MISILVFLFVIFSFSIFIASQFNKTVELALPLSIVSIVAIMFPFGLCSLLHIGALLVITISVFVLLLSLHNARKAKKLNELVACIFTSAIAWVCFFLIVFAISLRGKLFDQWDEFSHWGDVVKASVDINGFSTNPASMSAFQSYPPGMQIFQYLLQRINITLGGSFSERRAYYSYDVFLLCFMAPVFSKLSLKSPFVSGAAVLSIMLLPTLFYKSAYYSLYIDLILSCVFGYGLYTVLQFIESPDKFFILSICACCFILVLLKDVGILFSITLAVLYLRESHISNKKWSIIAIAFSIIIPALTWKINVKLTKANEVFPLKYDVVELWNVLCGGGKLYRQAVLKGFPRHLVSTTYSVGNTGISISYFTLLIVISLLSVYSVHRFLDNSRISAKQQRAILYFAPLFLLIYTICLLVTYMFQFEEYEALHFASFERYLAIPLLGILLFILYIWLDIKTRKKNYIVFLILCVLLYSAPIENIYSFLSRDVVNNSIITRSKYSVLDRKIKDNVNSVSNIYVISQQDNGLDFWVMHYLFRPNIVKINQLPMLPGYARGGYSIGKPYYEGDVWSSDISPEDLLAEWIDNYDYVAILHANEYLNEHYSSLFDSVVHDNSIYYIDKTNSIAILIE